MLKNGLFQAKVPHSRLLLPGAQIMEKFNRML